MTADIRTDLIFAEKGMFSTLLNDMRRISRTLPFRLSVFHCYRVLIDVEDLDNMFTEYEIVHPSLVTVNGDFISHDVRNVGTPHQRRRRSADDEIETIVVAIGDSSISRAQNNTIDVRNDTIQPDENITYTHWRDSGFNEARRIPVRTVRVESTDVDHEPPPRLIHFSVRAFGSRMRISVETKEHLIAPGAKSVRFTSAGEMIEKDISSDCLYFGKVSQLPDSAVAISNCQGLVSVCPGLNN